MAAFRIFLIALFTTLVGYTGIVIANHGLGLFNIFFGDIAVMDWSGQFNLDFMFMLVLSALWVAWRHKFSYIGIFLSILALFGGSLFLTIYLSIVSWQTNGDIKQVLLGTGRVQENSNGV